jgi:hypothetical protein
MPMNPKNDHTPRKSADTPLPKRRFRIEKLEERIAPKKGGKGTNNCGGSNGADDTIGTGSIY